MPLSSVLNKAALFVEAYTHDPCCSEPSPVGWGGLGKQGVQCAPILGDTHMQEFKTRVKPGEIMENK